MFWLDGEVKMSSSRIIKPAESENLAITDFSFRAIEHSASFSAADQYSGGFVPMGLYRGEQLETLIVEEADIGPPTVELSEEELNQRLLESFNAGLKEGKELAERGLINVFRALRSSSEAIHDLREKVLREAEDELINLIMQVARKVIIREVSQDATIFSEVVKNALAGLSARDEITVRISPDDYLLATTGRKELLQNQLLGDRLILKPDPSVTTGFCLVDTAMGTLDASLDGQLEQLYRTLLEQRTAAVPEEQ